MKKPEGGQGRMAGCLSARASIGAMTESCLLAPFQGAPGSCDGKAAWIRWFTLAEPRFTSG